MEPQIKTPYYSPNVPEPLPAMNEIEAGELIVDHNGWKVTRVRNFVVKYGDSRTLNLIQGEHMLFVDQATNSKVKVPKVYALYSAIHDSILQNFIIMEYIEGSTLEILWPNLSETEKESIALRLKDYFDQLRKILPPGYYGSIGRQPLLHEIFWTEPTAFINGPFNSEKDLNEAIALKYAQESVSQRDFKSDFYRRSLNNVFKNHPPCFTHGDFQRKNILVKTGQAGIEITMIDWESSGWLPSY
ncbi:hypothetical protein H072_2356 [Dactylellina haptotyla CBS 200.50]|uniref:Aminoglycoside phosphotransferase domain-containing protein n=1 Tax=Dactylellina haptotyla (strain CBS 200.50) TaxID=1284197 RepID=S8C7D8_DACHA|nr:hypothetical protein H072_2356 [Dactylellina haptotyla CBS 200.50]